MAATATTGTDATTRPGGPKTTTVAIGGIGAVTGLLAGAAGALVGGGDGVATAGGVGLLGGAAVALAAAFAARPWFAGAAPSGAPAAGAGRPAGTLAMAALPAGAVTAATDPRSGANLEPLVTAIGRRFLALSDRQLDALGTRGSAADDLDAARRLALRTRRAASTLVVLADPAHGSEPTAETTLGDVITLALADNDHRTQVDTSSVHPATIDGSAVADLVHLLAELIDNAVVASAEPRTTVAVLGRRVRDGYVLSVVDEGIGMAPTVRESSNGLLAGPPDLAAQQADALGLSVVGRLAARHGIGVTLLESATDGIIAKIRVPARLLDGGTAALPTPYERTVEALEAVLVRPDDAPGELELANADDEVIDLTDAAMSSTGLDDTGFDDTGFADTPTDDTERELLAEPADPTAGRTITKPMKSARPTRR